MSEPFLAEIRMVGFGFAPRGWALCNGQMLPINQNQGLFSLLGTTYGGDGQVTFGLPEMRGRAPVHFGASPGSGASLSLGERSGLQTVALSPNDLPAHTHAVAISAEPATSNDPTGRVLAKQARFGPPAYAQPNNLVALNVGALGNTGGSVPHPNMQPSAVINFVIALQGIFPSQN